ncbi:MULTISPECIES: CHASE3 domain-containing protein [Rhodopseudomonas]|uniref:histidine kinase n=1 Tax=Rhodopseudomonas palustris TaxID=1076 RepID=A0A0D7EHN1_RHOPL|nr:MULTISPECIES: CHASE3 domain-containing protein [Rhodopseudomonas]KIZ40253.1 histidine kinase [Rhodopseudomonas palustris]MDF3811308.1 CHASE3 domain-containing protein [Rhodopseudomonas sp. BAL398]WOK18633.1 CHASE3 domain-containing protein [Rhodopseudomonas sp. BAL398]
MTVDRARERGLVQIALLALAFAVLVAVSIGSVYWLEQAREDSAWVAHTLEVENQISLTQLQMRRAESAERGFVLTSQSEFMDEFQDASEQIMPLLQQLRGLVQDNDVQRPLIAEVVDLTEKRLAQFRQVLQLAKENKIAEANAIIRDATGRDAMSRIRDLTADMRTEEQRLFTVRTDAADRSQSLASIVTTTGSGLVLVLAGVSIFLVRRSARARDEAEGQLRDNNLNLEATVDERTSDLREANEEIQRFAYIVSHDLRSPLVNIMGFTSELEELRGDIFRRIATLARAAAPQAIDASLDDQGQPLLDEADKQLSQDFTEALGFIKSSIGKMDRLISAILNLTREGRREFQPVQIDTRELIENIASTVAHQAAEAEAEIRIEPLPEIVSDRLALEQIFSNLIDNALKYLKPGVPGDISIRGHQRLGFAIFEVADNGRGIDPKDHQRIFDLFRRAGTQDKPGQGIGLAHVRALVRRLGGTMSVASELGRGSTFTITLPAKWTASKRDKRA